MIQFPRVVMWIGVSSKLTKNSLENLEKQSVYKELWRKHHSSTDLCRSRSSINLAQEESRKAIRFFFCLTWGDTKTGNESKDGMPTLVLHCWMCPPIAGPWFPVNNKIFMFARWPLIYWRKALLLHTNNWLGKQQQLTERANLRGEGTLYPEFLGCLF